MEGRMTEEEIREKITEIAANIWREEITVTHGVALIFSLEVYKGCTIRDLILRGRLEAENQDLPENPYNPTRREPIFVGGLQVSVAGVPAVNEVTDDGYIGYAEAQQDMLTPDANGDVWVKCQKKEAKDG
jgi:hypothetical protein